MGVTIPFDAKPHIAPFEHDAPVTREGDKNAPPKFAVRLRAIRRLLELAENRAPLRLGKFEHCEFPFAGCDTS